MLPGCSLMPDLATINGIDLFLFVWAVLATTFAIVGKLKVADYTAILFATAEEIDARFEAADVWQRRWNRDWRKAGEQARAAAGAPVTEPGRTVPLHLVESGEE